MRTAGLLCVLGLSVACGLTWLSLPGETLAEQKAADQAETRQPTKKQMLKKFMRRKLEASTWILEGLSVEDFELISKGAAELKKLSEAEEWRVSTDPLYRQHSHQFQAVAERLAKHAEDKKLDGAALDWIEATMSCIECHKWVRATLVAGE